MTPGRTARPQNPGGMRKTLRLLAAAGLALLLSLPAFVPASADPPAAAPVPQATGPAAPAPQATKTPKSTKKPKPSKTPKASPTPTESPSAETSPTPSPSPSPSRRPDPEGDRWVQLAIVGGGSLLGAVMLFMVIGGLIRVVNRRRNRRIG